MALLYHNVLKTNYIKNQKGNRLLLLANYHNFFFWTLPIIYSY